MLGKQHPDVVHTARNLAVFLHKRGKLSDAEKVFRSALAGADSKPEAQLHHNTWYCMANYANLLNDLGRLDEAKRLCDTALAAQRRTIGDDHPDTIESMKVLGWINSKAAAQ